MNKDIESGIEHVANEVLLQIGNTQKWNADAIRWVDGVVYVVSRNVKRNGELGERYTVVTAEQWFGMHRVPGDESCVARLESYCESEA